MSNFDTFGKESNHPRKLVLVLDADATYGAALAQAIREETPYVALAGRNTVPLIKMAQEVDIDLILLDDQFPDMESVEALCRFQRRKGLKHVPALFIYGCSSSSPHDNKSTEKVPNLENLYYVLQEILV